jgi:tetratricopeptide (TPR) repeat protein
LLEKTIEQYPKQKGDGSSYALLAGIYRKAKDPHKEKAILRQWAKNSDEASDALLRLLELEKDDPKALQRNARQFLEINPLIPQPYRALANAEQQSGKRKEAIRNFETELKLNPSDPAEVHYQLAKLFGTEDTAQAKRHALLALEEAPRYREAHKFLLSLEEGQAVPAPKEAVKTIPGEEKPKVTSGQE